MAKGQQRSNREQRKPKKEKKPEKVDVPFGSQISKVANANDARRKPKG